MNQKGFSLVELLISVTVLLIIGGIGTSSYIRQLERGRDQQRSSDLARIQSALEKFRADKGTYPKLSTGTGDVVGCDTSRGECGPDCPCASSKPTGSNWTGAASLNQLVTDGYLESLPVDPVNDADHFYTFELTCAGEANDTVCGRVIQCAYGCCAYALGLINESNDEWETVCSPSAIQ